MKKIKSTLRAKLVSVSEEYQLSGLRGGKKRRKEKSLQRIRKTVTQKGNDKREKLRMGIN